MKTKHFLLNTVLLLAFLISACDGTNAPADTMMDDKETPATESMMEDTATTPDAMMPHETPTNDSIMKSPDWYSMPLINARTEQVFMISDFKGKVILVETMAIWCSNCLKQQGQVKTLHGLIGERDDFVSLGLDIDLNENAVDLKNYVEGNEFDWLYAVAPVGVAQDLSKQYGDQFLNPPSTPMLVIDRKGEAHPLPFGIKSAEELLNFIQPFLDEGM